MCQALKEFCERKLGFVDGHVYVNLRVVVIGLGNLMKTKDFKLLAKMSTACLVPETSNIRRQSKGQTAENTDVVRNRNGHLQ